MPSLPEPMLHGTILLVDSDPESLTQMGVVLQQEGHRILQAAEGGKAREILEQEPVDAAVVNLQIPGGNSFDVLRAACAKVPPVPVVVMTRYGTVEDAVKAMRLGAVDYVVKPLDVKDLQTSVHQALERRKMLVGVKVEEFTGFGGLLGVSVAMQGVFDQIRRVAPFRSTVLITGESGTGKELAARATHALSSCSSGPFVAVNCSALPRDLVESQLFGYERGAFTGASACHIGLLEAANRGTLFLDEIGDLALEAQAKLLRVIEDRQVLRVGATRLIPVNVRLLVATHADLSVAVQQRQFREDLFYRLNVLSISLPPLRERCEDIPMLMQAFLDRFAGENGLQRKQVSPEALTRLMAYDWPGNVRELKNLAERIMVSSRDDMVQVAHLPAEFHNPRLRSHSVDAGTGRDKLSFIGMTLAEIEEMVIRRTLEHTGGNRTRAARMLDISLRTLQRKLKEYDLPAMPE